MKSEVEYMPFYFNLYLRRCDFIIITIILL